MSDELYRKFKETGQEKIRLEMALKGFFSQQEEDEQHICEYANYLKKRIRPAMENLIEAEETEKMEQLEALGWFGRKELESFLFTAEKRQKLSALVCLMQIKNRKYGYEDRDFSL